MVPGPLGGCIFGVGGFARYTPEGTPPGRCTILPLWCRAIISKGMVFRYTWVFILTKIQWHIHAGPWSLVNCLAGSLYKALYKVLMNINECGCRPHGWPRP